MNRKRIYSRFCGVGFFDCYNIFFWVESIRIDGVLGMIVKRQILDHWSRKSHSWVSKSSGSGSNWLNWMRVDFDMWRSRFRRLECSVLVVLGRTKHSWNRSLITVRSSHLENWGRTHDIFNWHPSTFKEVIENTQIRNGDKKLWRMKKFCVASLKFWRIDIIYPISKLG